MSVKSKHSSTKKEKVRKKEKRKKVEESEEDIESSEEELDLTKECHPIGYYMNDRHEMINQMFSVIKGNKLKAMLPPVLRDYDIEYLKLQCLDQLLGMSEKRIQCILEGEILDTSSESDIPDSDNNESEGKNGTSSGSSSEKMDESHDEGKSEHGSQKRRKKRKSDLTSDGKSKVQKVDGENPPEKGKTLLEILELEMRARAIRALLKQGGNENANDNKTDEANQNGEKEISGEVVDLTECEEDELPIPGRKEQPETDIDKKVSKFEEKIEKSAEKVNQNQEEKAKKLQAELELRNKLFKKKIYRTRQQRMENDEEEKAEVKQEIGSEENIDFNNVQVKEEPKEPEDIVIEDPEEGEVSTSEDEYPVEIKQEPVEPEPEPVPEPEPEPVDYEPKIDAEGERLAAMDNGAFVMNENMGFPSDFVADNEESQTQSTVLEEKNTEETTETVAEEPSESSNLEAEKETEPICEETSWRERWLKRDGVQKLVKSSKIYAKVKKRIAEKSQKSKEEAVSLTPYEMNSDSSNSNFKLEAFEGSIEEYERLTGKSLDKVKESEKPLEEVQNEETIEKKPEVQDSKETQEENGTKEEKEEKGNSPEEDKKEE